MNTKFFMLMILFDISFSFKLKQNDIFTNWQIGEKLTTRGNGPLAESIRCEKNDDNEHFSALLTLPAGFGTVPVFNEASNVNPSISEECAIKPTIMGGNKFTVDIINFDACGVQMQKGIDGAIWMSVSIRFPLIGALRTAEDEIQNPPRTVFSSSTNEFDCSLDIFAKSDDENDDSFTRKLPNDGIIQIGQEMQLRANVRSGDGWKYAMLRDVTVHKVDMSLTGSRRFEMVTPNSLKEIDSEKDHQKSASHKFEKMFSTTSNMKKSSHQKYGRNGVNREKRQIPDAAFLVLSDGCRNPVFRSIAEDHPIQDSDNNLNVNFNFKAFMFQDMEDSGTIRVTAKVMACVELEDCQPTQCIDDDEYGFGRRKRSVTQQLNNGTQISDFSRELQFKVVLPGYASVRTESDGYIEYTDDFINKKKCHNMIYFMGILSFFFCSAMTCASTIIIIRSKRSKQSY